jgi:hypothetical protein
MCIVVTDIQGKINAINPFALNEFGLCGDGIGW